MTDFTIESFIRNCETEEDLDVLAMMFELDEHLTLAALETRARLVSNRLTEMETNEMIEDNAEQREIEDSIEALIADDENFDGYFRNLIDTLPSMQQSGGRMEKRIRDQDFDDDDDDFQPRSPAKKRQHSPTTIEPPPPPPPPPPMQPEVAPVYRIDQVSEVNVKKFNTRGLNYDIQFNDIDASNFRGGL